MNSKTTTFFLCLITLVLGILLYALQHQWIIVRGTPIIYTNQPQNKTKKICSLYYWHHHRWNTESQELIWSSHVHENIATLISSWLSALDTEQILPKKVILQSVTLAPHRQDAYLSFDRTIVPKEWSIHDKLMLIEGLLKTMRSNGIPLHRMYLLVHHQPLIDPHLDFSDAWPIAGFLAT